MCLLQRRRSRAESCWLFVALDSDFYYGIQSSGMMSCWRGRSNKLVPTAKYLHHFLSSHQSFTLQVHNKGWEEGQALQHEAPVLVEPNVEPDRPETRSEARMRSSKRSSTPQSEGKKRASLQIKWTLNVISFTWEIVTSLTSFNVDDLRFICHSDRNVMNIRKYWIKPQTWGRNIHQQRVERWSVNPTCSTAPLETWF